MFQMIAFRYEILILFLLYFLFNQWYYVWFAGMISWKNANTCLFLSFPLISYSKFLLVLSESHLNSYLTLLILFWQVIYIKAFRFILVFHRLSATLLDYIRAWICFLIYFWNLLLVSKQRSVDYLCYHDPFSWELAFPCLHFVPIWVTWYCF